MPDPERGFPWVDIVCNCHEPEAAGVPHESAIADDDHEQETGGAWADPFSRHALETLYFCEQCHTHRCVRCVDTDIVALYCPQCLFEVTTSGARAEGNRCARNCFRCPACDTAVTVVSADTEQEAYKLKCPYCEWTSTSAAGVMVAKPSAVVSQVQAQPGRTQTQIDARFQAMREFYFDRSLEEGVSMATSTRRASGVGMGTPGAETTASTFAEILDRRIRDKTRKDEGSEIFGDIVEVDEGLDQSNALLQASTSSALLVDHGGIQRDRVDREQGFPVPQALRAKRAKRCRGCQHLLVKPEAKPSSIKFKIKLMAL